MLESLPGFGSGRTRSRVFGVRFTGQAKTSCAAAASWWSSAAVRSARCCLPE